MPAGGLSHKGIQRSGIGGTGKTRFFSQGSGVVSFKSNLGYSSANLIAQF